jgi:hypothetical protein
LCNKLYKKHCRTNRRKYSFSQRVVAHWNALPESVINATSVNSFKNRLNNHWKNIEIKFVPDFYGPEAGIRQCFLYILYLCPLVVAVLFLGNMVSISTLSIPFMILKVSTTSALQEDINTKYTRSIVVQIEENTVFPKE